jgi:hypothetical protein
VACTAAATRARTSSLTEPPASARDTVDLETPAARATSLMLMLNAIVPVGCGVPQRITPKKCRVIAGLWPGYVAVQID